MYCFDTSCNKDNLLFSINRLIKPKEVSSIFLPNIATNADFFAWLEQNMQALLNRDKNALTYAIEVSCQTKANVVAADERESGQRALLNLGHTFGHAIENGLGYGEWLHGEAVAAGMCMAATMSNQMGWMSDEDTQKTTNLIEQAKLPCKAPESLTAENFLELMSVDKKVLNGVLRLVLMKGIGQALITDDFKAEDLNKAISHSLPEPEHNDPR